MSGYNGGVSGTEVYFKDRVQRNGAGKFPNPFYDVASEFIPTDINNVLEWCEYIWLTFGTWRSASKRVVRYFLTDLVLEGESEDERDDFESFLKDDLHIMTELGQIGDEYMTYGNAFISMFFPFDRWFTCPGCKFQAHSESLNYKYDSAKGFFNARCHKCHYDGPWGHEDRRSPDRSKVKIIRWNPKQIRMRVHPVSGKTSYFWSIPQKFIQKIQEGKHFYINDTPWPILETITKSASGSGRGEAHGPLFEFHEGAIYHFKENNLAGLPIVGWGIPSIIPNFKLVYYIQVLRRFDEAIAHDFIVPFRVLYPDAGPSPAQDPLTTTALSGFVSTLQSLKKQHRMDPTNIAIAPFKVGYEMLGGEGQQLTPKDQIMAALDELLNSLGYPAELYRGNLSIQAAPIALRLFEKTWGSLVDGYNDLIRWMLDKLSKHFMWGDITGKLQSVTLADDMERKALNLQAAAGMDVSKGTAYRPFGIDYLYEQERIVQEQQAIQKLQQEAMEETQAQQGMEGAATGGAGGEVGATPGDVHDQAKQLAQQLLFQTPETQRRSELIKIKHSNPTLHALVIQEMDTVRQEAATQGQSMVMEQQKQQMGAAGGGMVAQASAGIETSKRNDITADVMSSFAMDSLISDAVLSYNQKDWQKLACAVKDIHNTNAPAYQAFRYAFRKLKGWDDK